MNEEKLVKDKLEEMHNSDGFCKFLQLVKEYLKVNDFKKFRKHNLNKNINKFCEELDKIDMYKKDVIIFKVNPNKIKKVELEKKRNIFFPFEKIFLECSIYHKEANYIGTCYGVLLFREIVKDGKCLIIAISMWEIYDINSGKNFFLPSLVGFKEKELFSLDHNFINLGSKDDFSWTKLIKQELINNIQRLITCIDKKEYTTYRKWTPTGTIEKPIVYEYDVRTHMRHFWEDTGYFKIPNMSKEELKINGYNVHEVVYRDGQLKRDVPYKLIGSFKVNEDKEKKTENRKIILLEKRIFRQEEKLLKIIQEIFPDEFIKRHDRKILKGLELDILLREKRLAFEYDGEQHFDRKLCEEVFKSDFDALKKRDKEKEKRCKKKNITLIRVKYDEPLTKTYIQKKIRMIKQ